MDVLWIAGGAAFVLLTMSDIFLTVIVPRPTGQRWRPSSVWTRYLWYSWAWFAHRFVKDDQLEDFLGTFAPFSLATSLATWVGSLILGYGLVLYGLREQIRPVPNFGEAVYFAGSSLLTIGYGDFAPIGAAPRFLSLAAGSSGLAAFAILTTFLFMIFGSYQTREAFVVVFTNRAGAPPSAVEMILTHVRLGAVEGLQGALRESQLWFGQVLETHLSYPILAFMRSTHDDISWVAVVGTILDASTLAITTLDLPNKGEAFVVNRLGRHLARDFTNYFGFSEGDVVGIEREEFDAAYARLREAEIPLIDVERAWIDFSAIRSTYARPLNEMARFWRIPPAQWVGDRSLISHHPPLEFGPKD